MTVIAKYMWDVESSVRGIDIQPSTKCRPDIQSIRKSSSPHAKLQFNTHTYPARKKLHDEKNQTAGTNSAKHTLVLHKNLESQGVAIGRTDRRLLQLLCPHPREHFGCS
jgi:hypothetical protein